MNENTSIENKRLIDTYLHELIALMDQRYTLKGEQVNGFQPVPMEFLNMKACAELTGYKEGYLRQLVFRNEIPYHKTPRRRPVRFKRSEIMEWLSGKKYTPISERAEDYVNSRKIK